MLNCTTEIKQHYPRILSPLCKVIIELQEHRAFTYRWSGSSNLDNSEPKGTVW